MIIFDLLFLKQVKAWPQQKYTQQIWIHLVEYSSFKVSGPSEVPRFVLKLIFYLVKEVKLARVSLIELDDIVLVRTSDNLARVCILSKKNSNC